MYFNKEIIFKNQKSQSVAAIPHLQKIYLLTKTRAECQEMEANQNIKEAIELHLKCLAEDGVPLTTRSGVREVAVAVSL